MCSGWVAWYGRWRYEADVHTVCTAQRHDTTRHDDNADKAQTDRQTDMCLALLGRLFASWVCLLIYL